MIWLLAALLGVGAFVVLSPAIVEQKFESLLSEMGISPTAFTAMFAANTRADQQLSIAQSIVGSAHTTVISPQQLDSVLNGAVLANQDAAHKTAAVADDISRFIKGGGTHKALRALQDEVARKQAAVAARDQDITTLRQMLAANAPEHGAQPAQSQPMPSVQPPAKSPAPGRGQYRH
jgi:hypothetical protein